MCRVRDKNRLTLEQRTHQTKQITFSIRQKYAHRNDVTLCERNFSVTTANE